MRPAMTVCKKANPNPIMSIPFRAPQIGITTSAATVPMAAPVNAASGHFA